MKNNIDNNLYKTFHNREYPSDKVNKTIQIKLTEMEEKKIKESEIIENKLIKNKLVEDKKSYHKVKANFIRKIALVGFALTLISIITISTNVGGVNASIRKLFAFIPGVGIVKNDDSGILYYMKGDAQTKDNSNYEVKLNYIYASKDSVRITWEFILKSTSDLPIDEKPSLKAKLGTDEYPYVKLVIGDKIYERGSSLFSGVTTCETWITVKDATWNLTDVYQIIFGDISFEFSLQNYEIYKQTEDIGPTQRLNDISITAIPEWKENSVLISLYDLNFSEFDSIDGYKNPLSKDPPYLTIGDTIIKREKINLDRGVGIMVYNLSGIELTEEMKTTAVIHIPRIKVKKKEDQKIGISIAKDGSYHASTKSVQFSNSTMNIISVEKATKVEQYKDFENCLKLTLKFDYNMENLELENFSNLVLSDGKVKKLAWSCEYDENTGYYILYIQDYAGASKIKSITFGELSYYINDEYQINLGR